MHAYAHSWSPNNGDRNQVAKQPTFEHISFITRIIQIG